MKQQAPQNNENGRLADGVTVIPTKSDDFIRAWLEVMRPIHKLSPKEMDFAAILLERRYQIVEDFREKQKNQALVDRALFDKNTMEEIRAQANISTTHMKMLLRRLRMHNVLVGKGVNMKYFPKWERGKPYRLMFIFKNDD